MAWSTSDRRSRLPRDWAKRVAAVKARARGRCEALVHQPDCDGTGRECDHVRQGDDHALSNLQWLSTPCHKAKTKADQPSRKRPTATHPGLLEATSVSREAALAARARARQSRQVQQGARVVLVVGPPCSGKTTYVREQMHDGDLVIDHDAIAVALGSPNSHRHPRALIPYILKATEELLDRTGRDPALRCAWLIRCSPTATELQRASEVVVLDTPMDVCKQRARETGRDDQVMQAIDSWTPPTTY